MWSSLVSLSLVRFQRAALVCALLFIAWAHARFYDKLLLPVDEAYLGAFGWRMATGHFLPYVDAVSHRGPFLYDVVGAFALVFGGGSVLSVRACAFACIAGTSLLLGRTKGGGIASLAYAIGTIVVLWDEMALDVEHVLDVVAIGALVVTQISIDKKSTKLAILAGAIASLAPLCKQPGAFVPAILAAWMLLVSRRMLGAFALGAIVPPLLYVVRYAIAGELATFRYWFLTYNAKVYMAPYTSASIAAEILRWCGAHPVMLLLGIALAAHPFVVYRKTWREHLFALVVSACALASLIAAKAAVRDFPHYYLQIVPWFALLGSLVLQHHLRETWNRPVFAAIALASVLFFVRHEMQVRASPALVSHAHPLCDAIDAHARPGEPMFVWGFQPWHYFACHRRPASRYVFTTFQMGFVPWFFDVPRDVEETRVVPGTRETLIADLEKEHAVAIVDAPIGGRHMRDIPELAAFLDRSYCSLGTIVDPSGPMGRTTVDLYVRKEGTCP